MSNTIEIKVPDIGDFGDVPVIELLVSAGDRVDVDDGLITLESDKATMEVPSSAAGVIKELLVSLDDTVSEGDVVAVLEAEEDTDGHGDESDPEGAPDPEQQEETGQDEEAAAKKDDESERGDDTADGEAEEQEEDAGRDVPPPEQDEARPEPSSARASGLAAVDPSRVPYASPSVRKFARELGVDLAAVEGSGRKGRIVRDDVAAHVKKVFSGEKPAAGAASGSIGGLKLDFPTLPEVDFSRYGEVERKTLSRIQKISAAHLHRNWVGIPHVTQHDEADITDMEAFRRDNVEDAKAQGFKLTPLVFLMKAMVASLKAFPRFNASLDSDGETLVLKQYFNIGVAVDTPDGLVVPVVRDCDRKGIMELARELADTSAKAREGKLKPQDIQGGCISISSLGGIGGTAFTPIINAPEVAILGVSRSAMKPVWNGEEFHPRLMLPLSLSYDHRVIDGAAAARFTRFLASRLEDLRRLTL
ncbi:MAG: dihydrolipoyllysine-residue acetyltransferase [Xanthomonadales bacterium]|nr:dihydrolipoyllysine-residue acetyltransferase [Xanthomonadales bacterium]